MAALTNCDALPFKGIAAKGCIHKTFLWLTVHAKSLLQRPVVSWPLILMVNLAGLTSAVSESGSQSLSSQALRSPRRGGEMQTLKEDSDAFQLHINFLCCYRLFLLTLLSVHLHAALAFVHTPRLCHVRSLSPLSRAAAQTPQTAAAPLPPTPLRSRSTNLAGSTPPPRTVLMAGVGTTAGICIRRAFCSTRLSASAANAEEIDAPSGDSTGVSLLSNNRM